jgi:hypothetical protein
MTRRPGHKALRHSRQTNLTRSILKLNQNIPNTVGKENLSFGTFETGIPHGTVRVVPYVWSCRAVNSPYDRGLVLNLVY